MGGGWCWGGGSFWFGRFRGEKRKKKLVGSMGGGEEGRGMDLDVLLKFGELIIYVCVDCCGGE